MLVFGILGIGNFGNLLILGRFVSSSTWRTVSEVMCCRLGFGTWKDLTKGETICFVCVLCFGSNAIMAFCIGASRDISVTPHKKCSPLVSYISSLSFPFSLFDSPLKAHAMIFLSIFLL